MLFTLVYRAHVTVVLFVFFFSVATHAKEEYNTTVYGSVKRLIPKDDPSGFTTVFEINDIAPGTELADILDNALGLKIKRSGVGQRATFSLRGAQSGQTLVVLDDIRLTSPSGNADIDLSLISPAHLQEVQVRRSGGSARFGSGAIGGVLILKTPRLRMRPKTNLSIGYGSWNSLDARASTCSSIGNFRYLASGIFRRSDGNFAYIDENGTSRIRSNNDSQMGELLLKADHLLSDNWNFGITNSFAMAERGAPGMSQRPSETARQFDLHNITSVRASRYDLFIKQDSLTLSLFHNYGRFRFDESTPPPIYSHNHSFAFGGNINIQMPLPKVGRVDGGAEIRADFFRDSATDNPSRLSTDIWVAGQTQLLNSHFIFSPTVRLSIATNFDINVIPKAGLVFRPFTKSHNRWLQPLEFAGNIGRSFRFPTFSEMFIRLDGFGGNPDLKPEDALVGDVGLRWRFDIVYIETTYFKRYMKNTILFAPVSSFLVRADNYSGVRAEGIESALEISPFEGFNLNTSYTYTKAEFGEPSMQLPGQPAHRFVGRLSWTGNPKRPNQKLGKSWRWFNGLHLWTSITLESNMVLSRFNTTEEEGRVFLAAGGQYNYQWITLSVEGRNLLDKRNSLDTVGFPLAPASFWASVSTAF